MTTKDDLGIDAKVIDFNREVKTLERVSLKAYDAAADIARRLLVVIRSLDDICTIEDGDTIAVMKYKVWVLQHVRDKMYEMFPDTPFPCTIEGGVLREPEKTDSTDKL